MRFKSRTLNGTVLADSAILIRKLRGGYGYDLEKHRRLLRADRS